jgi:hypothetical protein
MMSARVRSLITNSVPQSEETRAELSQIAWVPRQVHIVVLPVPLVPGARARHTLRYTKVYASRQFLRLESGPEYPTLATWLGREDSDAGDTQAKASLDGETIGIDVYTERYQYHVQE